MMLTQLILTVILQVPVFHNPVIRHNCADPTVLDDRARTGYFYAYSTRTKAANLPVYRSKDLVDWEFVGDGFPDGQPSWVKGSSLWAPDINYVDGHYQLYYALGVWDGVYVCGSGVATSDSPTGPFIDHGEVVSTKSIGVTNCIDPCFFDDGKDRYLFWGSLGPGSGVWAVKLSDDGLSVAPGAKKKRLAATNMEGAYIMKRGRWFYLFTSKGSCCEGEKSTYRIMVARSKKVMGPYLGPDGKKFTDLDYENSIMTAPDDKYFVGTGHNSQIIKDDAGQDWMFYHAFWKESRYSARCLNLDAVKWTKEEWPYFESGHPSTESSVPVISR